MARRKPLDHRIGHRFVPTDADGACAEQWRQFLAGGRVICPWFDVKTGALVLDAADSRGIWFESEAGLADEIQGVY